MAVMNKKFVGLLPGIANAGGLAIRNGNGVNGIGVLMVENKNIIISTTGGDVETTSLIRIGLQEERLMGKQQNRNLMGARLKLRGNVDVEVGGKNETSGTNVLSLLILMTEGSSKGGDGGKCLLTS